MTEYDPRAYWVWLQHALGAGSSKPNRILEGFPTLRDFCDAGKGVWLLEGYFTQREIRGLCGWPISAAAAFLEYCGESGQRIVTPDDAEYPELLRQIPNPPCALYIKGTLPDFSLTPAVAIVGTRKATATGRAAARSIAFELAKKGAVVVSGGALGIDTAAHQGALQAGGKTICVLGCGIDTNYLMSNALLRDTIAAKGALISEFPPGTQPLGSNFPIRNRIISGLSLGTLVVEAAAKSGSLITADYALDQGRDVFAVPADIFSPVSQGVNGLIKCGAKPVSRADEILEEYRDRFPTKNVLDGGGINAIIDNNGVLPKNVGGKAEEAYASADEFSADAQLLLGCMTRTPCHISGLGEKTGLGAARLLSAVTELELAGAVKSYSGRRYSLPR